MSKLSGFAYADGPSSLQVRGVTADSFEALAEHALNTLRRRNKQVAMVCGPLSTGGTKHQILNFAVFNAAIRGLRSEPIEVFDQTPYEYGLRKLARAWEEAGNTGYCMPILEVFYARIFESGYVRAGYFIPGWKTSHGAQWERNELLRLRIPVKDFSRADVRRYLALAQVKKYNIDEIMRLLPTE